jgi:hypothetical protein
MDTRDCRVSEVLNPVPPQCRLSTHAVVGACLLCRATGTATACDDNVQSRTSVRAVPVQPCRLAAPGSLGLGEDSPAVLQTPCHAYRTLVIHSLLSSPLLPSPLLSASALWVVAAGGAAAATPGRVPAVRRQRTAVGFDSIMVVGPGCPGCALRHHGSVVGMSVIDYTDLLGADLAGYKL